MTTSTMIHVSGLDAGGTKTVCLLADEQGTVIARARARRRESAGGRRARGREGAARRDGRGDRRSRDRAGGDLPRHRRRRSAGRSRRHPRHHEAHRPPGAASSSSTTRWWRWRPARRSSPGSSSFPGTGSIAYGRNARGEAARAGGWGYVLGDEGSGYWIGRAALRAVLREADRRGPTTALSPTAAGAFRRRRSAQGLIHEVYHTNLKPAAIGALAHVRAGGVLAGDAVAIGILARRGRRARERRRCPSRAGSSCVGEPFTFILAGGIFRAVPWLTAGARTAPAGRGAEQPGPPARSRARRRAPSPRAAGGAWRRDRSLPINWTDDRRSPGMAACAGAQAPAS